MAKSRPSLIAAANLNNSDKLSKLTACFYLGKLRMVVYIVRSDVQTVSTFANGRVKSVVMLSTPQRTTGKELP